MTRYKFFLDMKCSVWERTHFTIEAETENAAIHLAAQFATNDLYNEEIENNGLTIEDSETIYDTMETLPVEANCGKPTVEIHFSNEDDLSDNVNGSVWDSWWKLADLRTKECICGLRQGDFDPANCYQSFVQACTLWWDGRPDSEKIEIWKNYANENI